MKRKKRHRVQSTFVSPLYRASAVLALVLQLFSFVVTLILLVFLDVLFGIVLHAIAHAVFQGVMAAVLSRCFRQQVWWQVIQFLFPIALVLLLGLHLPPPIFLAAFLILLLLYWSTYRTQVPFYPSGLDAWREVERLLPESCPVRFIDIGSGMGGLPLYLAKRHRDGVFIGIEIAPLPWLVSRLRALLTGSSAKFERGDYCSLDFSGYDIVFAYLSPAAMPALWQKASNEMQPGSLLISHEFPVDGVTADHVIRPDNKVPALYCWRM